MKNTRSTLTAISDSVLRSGYAGRETKALRKMEADHAKALNQLVGEAELTATGLVANYRAACAELRKTRGRSELTEAQLRSERAHQMQADRAAGGIDALHALFPDLAAWTETKWIH